MISCSVKFDREPKNSEKYDTRKSVIIAVRCQYRFTVSIFKEKYFDLESTAVTKIKMIMLKYKNIFLKSSIVDKIPLYHYMQMYYKKHKQRFNIFGKMTDFCLVILSENFL